MNEVALIEDRLFAEQDELLEQLLAVPGDGVGGPLITGLGDVLIASTGALRQNLAVVIDRLASATVQIQQLEAKVATLENREEIKFAGRHDKDRKYEKGSLVNYGGSAWIATDDVPAGVLPNASASWAILVKRGRDAAHRSSARNDVE